MSDDTRAAFEAWLRDSPLFSEDDLFKVDGIYTDDSTSCAWVAWQAAWSRRASLPPAPALPAGWVAAPLEPDAFQMDAGEAAFCTTARPGATWAEHTAEIYRAMLHAAPSAPAQAPELADRDIPAAFLYGVDTAPAVVASETAALIKECADALAEELAAWEIDPPLHHVKQAHDRCVAWLAAHSGIQPAKEAK